MASNVEKAMGILEICKIVSSEESAIVFLRENGIIKTGHTCSICNIEMKLVNRKERNDTEEFKCSSCYSKTSIRKGSIFCQNLLL